MKKATPGEKRYAVAIQTAVVFGSRVRVRYTPTDLYIIYPRSDGTWNVHASYHFRNQCCAVFHVRSSAGRGRESSLEHAAGPKVTWQGAEASASGGSFGQIQGEFLSSLQNNGFSTVGDVVAKTELEIWQLHYLGPTTLTGSRRTERARSNAAWAAGKRSSTDDQSTPGLWMKIIEKVVGSRAQGPDIDRYLLTRGYDLFSMQRRALEFRCGSTFVLNDYFDLLTCRHFEFAGYKPIVMDRN